MAINFNDDIYTALYMSEVASDPNFQSPGNFALPIGFGSFFVAGGAITTAGTGYTKGQLLTVTGGTFTTAATLTVLTVSIETGAVLTFEVNNPGAYSVVPTNPVSVTVGTFTANLVFTGIESQRILTLISTLVSYIDQIDSVYEAKLLQVLMGRIMAELRFGHTWNAATVATNALNTAMKYIATAPVLLGGTRPGPWPLNLT